MAELIAELALWFGDLLVELLWNLAGGRDDRRKHK
jgi:hypothetical protein